MTGDSRIMWDSPATLAMSHPANCEVSNNVQCRARVVVYQDAILVNPKVVVVALLQWKVLKCLRQSLG